MDAEAKSQEANLKIWKEVDFGGGEGGITGGGKIMVLDRGDLKLW